MSFKSFISDIYDCDNEEFMNIETLYNYEEKFDIKNHDDTNTLAADVMLDIAERAYKMGVDDTSYKMIDRPKDPDGEPFYLGDTVFDLYAESIMSGEVKNISALRKVQVEWEDGNVYWHHQCELTHTKPQPKVLDADGVPIEIGDKVWLIDEPNILYTVFNVDREEITIAPKGGINSTFRPTCITHKEPVLDTDGVPIKVGDTVWSLDTYEQFQVDAIYENGHLWSEGEDEHSGCYLEPKRVTHKEPDSLERIKDDQGLEPLDYYRKYPEETRGKTKTSHLLERAIALIERGA